MTYCTRCGAKNKEDAEYCVKCGAPLEVPRRPPAEEFGERVERAAEGFGKSAEEFGKRMEREAEMCFESPAGTRFLGVFFGVFLIWIGLALLWPQRHLWDLWPLIVVAFGLWVIYNTTRRSS